MTPRTMKNEFVLDEYRAAHERIVEQLRVMNDDISRGLFDTSENKLGHELELVVLDGEYQPAVGVNVDLMDSLGAIGWKGITVEGASWQMEINTKPKIFRQGSLAREEKDLLANVNAVRTQARKQDLHVGITGTLETVSRENIHSKDSLTNKPRYPLLFEAMARQAGRPMRIHINSSLSKKKFSDQNHAWEQEFQCTSSQQHMQVRNTENVPLYLNATMILAAPVLGIGANSPFIQGDGPYWYESRIPLFEQTTDMRTALEKRQNFPRRTGFGLSYYQDARDYFHAITTLYPVLLPRHPDKEPVQSKEIPKRNRELRDLRLHSGFVWWWVRPVIEYKPLHFRIENRSLPAGPTVRDTIANTAFYYGLMVYLIRTKHPILNHVLFPFTTARDNFYAAAQKGPFTKIFWITEQEEILKKSIYELAEEHLLDHADEGLDLLGIKSGERNKYLGVIRTRVKKRMIPADWKMQRVEELLSQGNTQAEAMQQLVKEYVKVGEKNEPLI